MDRKANYRKEIAGKETMGKKLSGFLFSTNMLWWKEIQRKGNRGKFFPLICLWGKVEMKDKDNDDRIMTKSCENIKVNTFLS